MIFKHIILHLSIADYHKENSAMRTFGGRGLFIMNYKYNVSCSETTSKSWTQTAVECYSLGCVCSKCNLYWIYFADSERKCKMKDTVIELVRKLGKPDKESYEY